MIQQPVVAQDMLGAATHLLGEMHRLRPEIERALAYTRGTHALDDIVVMVLQGRARLWTTPGSFMVVEKINYPRACHYHIFLAGGRLEELIGLHGEVIAAALDDGASKLTLTGRRGWLKPLEVWGWHETMATMEKEIA